MTDYGYYDSDQQVVFNETPERILQAPDFTVPRPGPHTTLATCEEVHAIPDASCEATGDKDRLAMEVWVFAFQSILPIALAGQSTQFAIATAADRADAAAQAFQDSFNHVQ